MKILKMLGIVFFFLHYYFMIVLALFKNTIYLLWKVITQAPT